MMSKVQCQDYFDEETVKALVMTNPNICKWSDAHLRQFFGVATDNARVVAKDAMQELYFVCVLERSVQRVWKWPFIDPQW